MYIYSADVSKLRLVERHFYPAVQASKVGKEGQRC